MQQAQNKRQKVKGKNVEKDFQVKHGHPLSVPGVPAMPPKYKFLSYLVKIVRFLTFYFLLFL